MCGKVDRLRNQASYRIRLIALGPDLVSGQMKEAASNMAYVAHECLSIPEVQKCLHSDFSLKFNRVKSVKHHHVLMSKGTAGAAHKAHLEVNLVSFCLF